MSLQPTAVPSIPDLTGELPGISGGPFAAFYFRWVRHVFRWLRALSVRQADAEDLAQEIFLIADRRLSSFDGMNPAGWLYRISENTVRNHRRSAWLRRAVLGQDAVDRFIDPAAQSLPETLERREEGVVLARALEQIHSSRRATFVLFEIEGYSGEEIAAAQRIPINTVWSRIRRARKELAEALGREPPNG